MRVLVCGDREWHDRFIIAVVLNGFLGIAMNEFDDLVVIDGAARGADAIAGEWYGGAEDGEHAIHERVTHVRFPAEWDKHGKAAGPIRNAEMLRDGQPDIVVAFNNDLDSSKGTKDMVDRAARAGVPVYHVRRVNP